MTRGNRNFMGSQMLQLLGYMRQINQEDEAQQRKQTGDYVTSQMIGKMQTAKTQDELNNLQTEGLRQLAATGNQGMYNDLLIASKSRDSSLEEAKKNATQQAALDEYLAGRGSTKVWGQGGVQKSLVERSQALEQAGFDAGQVAEILKNSRGVEAAQQSVSTDQKGNPFLVTSTVDYNGNPIYKQYRINVDNRKGGTGLPYVDMNGDNKFDPATESLPGGATKDVTSAYKEQQDNKFKQEQLDLERQRLGLERSRLNLSIYGSEAGLNKADKMKQDEMKYQYKTGLDRYNSLAQSLWQEAGRHEVNLVTNDPNLDAGTKKTKIEALQKEYSGTPDYNKLAVLQNRSYFTQGSGKQYFTNVMQDINKARAGYTLIEDATLSGIPLHKVGDMYGQTKTVYDSQKIGDRLNAAIADYNAQHGTNNPLLNAQDLQKPSAIQGAIQQYGLPGFDLLDNATKIRFMKQYGGK